MQSYRIRSNRSSRRNVKMDITVARPSELGVSMADYRKFLNALESGVKSLVPAIPASLALMVAHEVFTWVKA